MLLQIIVSLLLSIIGFQDFKNRSIPLFLFPLLFGLLFYYNFTQLGLHDLLQYFAYNLFFLVAVFAFVSVYFSIRRRKFVNIFKKDIAVGDFLFYIILAVGFNTVDFILFFVFSLILSIIVVFVISLKNKTLTGNIPLAGLLALQFLVIFVLNETLDMHITGLELLNI
jgi:hypothetical protein